MDTEEKKEYKIKDIIWEFIQENKLIIGLYIVLMLSYPLESIMVPHLYGKIIDISSTFYGYVNDVLHMPANDVLVISLDNKEYLIPMIDDVILNINHKLKEITIEPIPGLFN